MPMSYPEPTEPEIDIAASGFDVRNRMAIRTALIALRAS